MRRKNNSKIWILLMVLNVLLCLIFIYFKQPKYITAYISNKELLPFSYISEEDLIEVSIPKPQEIHFLMKKEDIVGKYTALHTTIPETSFFYEQSLISALQYQQYPDNLLKENEIPFQLNNNQVEAFPTNIQINQQYDFYVTIINKEGIPITDSLVTGLRVIEIISYDGSKLTHTNNNNTANTIVFALDKEYISYLSNAIQLGSIQLFLRVNQIEGGTLNQESLIIPFLQNEVKNN